MEDRGHLLPAHAGLTGLSDDPDAMGKHHNLGDILQKIMAITDESLDEAQAR